MTKQEFLAYWTLRKEEETDTVLEENDIFFKVGSYLFIVQADGNVLLKKIGDCKFTLKDAFRAFRLYVKKQGITHIRVEGTKRRYLFLSKMFPQLSFIKDKRIKKRNVWFVRL